MTALNVDSIECNSCGAFKEAYCFGTYVSKGTTYYRRHCKECRNAKAREIRDDVTREQDRKRYHAKAKENKEELSLYHRNQHLKIKYGITHDDYLQMLADQDGSCYICNLPAEDEVHGVLRVDHNHATGEVRGLLCHNCNAGLGHAKDSPEILLKMHKYLMEKGYDSTFG